MEIFLLLLDAIIVGLAMVFVIILALKDGDPPRDQDR